MLAPLGHRGHHLGRMVHLVELPQGRHVVQQPVDAVVAEVEDHGVGQGRQHHGRPGARGMAGRTEGGDQAARGHGAPASGGDRPQGEQQAKQRAGHQIEFQVQANGGVVPDTARDQEGLQRPAADTGHARSAGLASPAAQHEEHRRRQHGAGQRPQAERVAEVQRSQERRRDQAEQKLDVHGPPPKRGDQS